MMETMQTTLNKAIRYHQTGNLSKAESIYKKIIKKDKANADAWHLLGVLFYQMGEYDIAVNNIQKAIGLNPKMAPFYSNLGLAYHAKKMYEEAEASYEKALALQPAYPEALNNLANTLRERGQDGSPEYRQAKGMYERALSLRPAYPEALNGLAMLMVAEDDYRSAKTLLERALGIDPGFAKGYSNLGLVYRHLGLYDMAVKAFEKALSLPTLSSKFTLNALFETKKESCSWEGIEALQEMLVQKALEMPEQVQVDPFTTISKLTNVSKEKTFQLLKNHIAQAVDMQVATFGHTPVKKEKLHIGYLSGDLFDHPTMHLASALFGAHDKKGFEVTLFGLHADRQSEYFKKAAAGADRYVGLEHLSDEAAARAIYESGVDILVDLQGLTKNARPQILAYRPAPVQMQYLAFAGTTAHPAVDYILTDRTVTPETDAAFYSEQFIYLPGSYQVNDDSQEVAGSTPTRSECGLPEEGFVFCCFNNSYKIEPEVFSVWMEILKVVPKSVLWLYASNSAMKANLQDEAEKRGVASDRLVFAEKRPKPDHLARLGLADLFLDTFHYNAHTTASDALFMGVPLLTCEGDRFASRVAGSLLKSLNMDACITADAQEYQKRAIALATEKGVLQTLKKELADKRTTAALFDTKQFAAGLERGFRAAWKNYENGEKPRMITIESEVA